MTDDSAGGGVEFKLDRATQTVVAVEVSDDCDVAKAGGRAGDEWLEMDGEPAFRVIEEIRTGARTRSPQVPERVTIARAGELLTIFPRRAAPGADSDGAIAFDGTSDSAEIAALVEAVTLVQPAPGPAADAVPDNEIASIFSDTPDLDVPVPFDDVGRCRLGLSFGERRFPAGTPDEAVRYYELRSRQNARSAVPADYDPFRDVP